MCGETFALIMGADKRPYGPAVDYRNFFQGVLVGIALESIDVHPRRSKRRTPCVASHPHWNGDAAERSGELIVYLQLQLISSVEQPFLLHFPPAGD